MILKTDCKHFPGDKPCKPNKLENKKCDDCEYYSPIKFKILIIKLDAVGDVLLEINFVFQAKKLASAICNFFRRIEIDNNSGFTIIDKLG